MESRVILYSRQGCHLCEQARDVVAKACDEAGEQWHEVDVDADETLKGRYGDFVPVVEVDGDQVGFWRVKAASVREALARGQ